MPYQVKGLYHEIEPTLLNVSWQMSERMDDIGVDPRALYSTALPDYLLQPHVEYVEWQRMFLQYNNAHTQQETTQMQTLDNMTAKKLRDLAERAANAANAQEEKAKKEAKVYKKGKYAFDAGKKELTYLAFGHPSPSIFTNTRVVDFLQALEKDNSKSNDHELVVGLMNHIIEQKGAR